MDGYAPGAWESFALGQLGASGVLVGLVFVSLSGNLSAILESRELVRRAVEAIAHLVAVLFGSSLLLLPGQGRTGAGVELLVLGLVLLASVLVLQRGAGRLAVEAGTRAALVVRRVLGAGAPVLTLVAATSLLAGAGGGLYWWAASVLVSYAAAFLTAWVLQVEILR